LQSDLHTFIHSLSQNEKRYFKLQASLGFEESRKNYWHLYELILGQRNYNEQQIKLKLGSTRFAQQKKHLEEKLLDSLRSFHGGKSMVELVNRELSNYHIYSTKGLYKRAGKCLKRAEELARRFELYPELLRILEDSIPLITQTAAPKLIREQIQIIRQEIPIIQEKMDLSLLIQQEYLYFITLNKENEFLRRTEDAQNALKLVEQLENKICNKSIPAIAKCYFQYLTGLCFFLCGRFKESQKAFREELQVFEQFPMLKTAYADLYNRSLGNNALLAISLNQIKQLDSLFSSVSLIDLTGTSNQTNDLRNYLLRLRLYVKQANWFNAAQYIQANQIALITSEHQSSLKTESDYILFDTLRVYLELHEYRKARQLLHRFLSETDATLKTDNYVMARIIFVLLHLQQEETELAESEWKSLKRFIRKNNRELTFETQTLKFLSKLISNPSPEKQQQTIRLFVKELEQLKSKPEGQMTLFCFDLSDWLIGLKLTN